MHIVDRFRDHIPSVFLSVDARRRRILRLETQAGHDRADHNANQPSPAEQAALAVASHSAGRAEARHRSRLNQAGQRLLTATATAATVRGQVAITQAEPGRELRSKAHEEAERDSLAQRPDLRMPAIPAGIAAVLELAVPAVEFFFWHQTWSGDIDQRLPWWSKGQVGAVLLALMIPLVSVALAHATGVLLQRVMRHHRLASSGDYIGASVLGLLTIMIAVVVYRLVIWRYSTGASLGLSRLPAVPLAWVFVALLFLVVAIRAFCDSEQHRQHTELGRRVSQARRQDKQDLARIVAADSAVAAAWENGAGSVARCLADVDHVLATATVLLNDHWAVTGRQLHRVRSAIAPAGAVLKPESSAPKGIRAPEANVSSLLPDSWNPGLPLRDVRLLIDLLTDLRPPELVPAQERLMQLETRLRRIQNWSAAPAGEQTQDDVHLGDGDGDEGTQLSVVPPA